MTTTLPPDVLELRSKAVARHRELVDANPFKDVVAKVAYNGTSADGIYTFATLSWSKACMNRYRAYSGLWGSLYSVKHTYEELTGVNQ